MEYDVSEIPFARRGSWFNLSPVIGLHERAHDIHLVSHQTGMHPVLRLVPTRAGEEVTTTVSSNPSVLRWSADDGYVEAAFDTAEALRIRGRGLGMRMLEPSTALTPFTGSYLTTDAVDGATVLTSYETGRRYRVTLLQGDMAVEGAGALGTAVRAITMTSDDWEIALEEFGTAKVPYRSLAAFDDVVARSARDFGSYRDAITPGANVGAERAAYVLWSATVHPSGFFRRDAILMSKHWMDKVWSWDHCFNAIALAASDPAGALDQFLTPFDHQDQSGALPDSIAHSEILYNFVKPPIHGWAFDRIRALAPTAFTTDQLTAVYWGLARWTDFWLTSRRAPGHALPYYQHGNDSGWDNSTTFDADRLVESPDLAAFLVLQLRTLAGLAVELGIADSGWQTRADEMVTALAQLWDGDRFVARSVLTASPSTATSLLNCLPIILGEQLPHDIATKLHASISEHLTPWGLATERIDSELYESDGYWRGPIWAPSTVLIEDGLRRAGFIATADTIRDRFIALCDHGGFAENFDAITGDGLRDRAYTWTASAYLTLASHQRHEGTIR